MVTRLILAALFLASGPAAHAASFDCKKAATPQEKAICASPELSHDDDQMAAAYKATLASAPASARQDILDTQRALIRETSLNCKQAKGDLNRCLQWNYSRWIDRLQHILVRRAGVTFVMRSVVAADSIGEDNNIEGTLTITWPKALSNAPQWQAWNRSVERETHDMAANDESPYNGKMMDNLQSSIGEVSTSLDGMSSQMVFATIDGTLDSGGVHANEYWVEFNWLLKEQREAKQDDIFLPGSGWEKFFEGQCIAALKKQFGNDYMGLVFDKTLKDMRKNIAAPSNWRINSEGLTLVFPQYSITSHADQVDPILIPWSTLKPYLQPSFVLPQKL